jgi:PTH1 family peptidyl-tRNA hydrolase
MVVDEIARRHGLTWETAPSQLPESVIAKRFGVPAIMLARPLTYMNRSGEAVAALGRYFGVPDEELLVIYDDIDLDFGRLRALARGGPGTHNGMRSVVDRLGTKEFARLRLGVGRGDPRRDLADHVLAKFEVGERADVEAFIARAADAAEMFAAEGIHKVMNMYNAAPAGAADD